MRIRGIFAAVVSIAALSLTACSTAEDTASDMTASATSAAESVQASEEAEDTAEEGEATRVDVMENEFTIELSQTEFKPGKYTFVVMNHGNAPHDLTITGPGLEDEKSDRVSGGETTELTVDLEAGEYELWCSVGNHKAQGMTTTITVA